MDVSDARHAIEGSNEQTRIVWDSTSSLGGDTASSGRRGKEGAPAGPILDGGVLNFDVSRQS